MSGYDPIEDRKIYTIADLREYLESKNMRAKATVLPGIGVLIKIPEDRIQEIRDDIEPWKPIAISYQYEPIGWWECWFKRVRIRDGLGVWS